MEQTADIAELEGNLAELVALIQRLGEQPEVALELSAAFKDRDLDRFRHSLKLGGIEPPPDKCDPYVTVYLVVLGAATLVRRCKWTSRTLSPVEGQQLAEFVARGVSAERLSEHLIRFGLIECEWVREDQANFVEMRKFVQGMCPDSTF